MSKEFTVSQMKEMAKLYVQRIHATSTAGGIDITKENLILRIEKSAIDKYAANPDFDGFLAVIGLDNKDPDKPVQTVLLVPCDNEDKAISTNGVMIGEERHRPIPPKLQDVLYPGGGGLDILTGINNAFNSNGIKD